MNNFVILALALIAGLFIGRCIFFGGLWWTVRKGILRTSGALVSLGSRAAGDGVSSSPDFILSAEKIGSGSWPV